MKILTQKKFSEAARFLRKKGFKNNFVLADKKLRCIESEKEYDPSDMTIVLHRRFQRGNGPGSVVALFALHCTDSTKGLVKVLYGSHADWNMIGFLERVKVQLSPNPTLE